MFVASTLQDYLYTVTVALIRHTVNHYLTSGSYHHSHHKIESAYQDKRNHEQRMHVCADDGTALHKTVSLR